MPPRVRCPSLRTLRSTTTQSKFNPTPSIANLQRPLSSTPRQYATAASVGGLRLPDDYIPPTQPPTARRPEVRKSQLLRVYTSLLRSTPLILFFQHNNLTALEWAAIRRELKRALADVSVPNSPVDLAPKIHLEVIRTRMFRVAMKVVEFFDPSQVAPSEATTLTGRKTKVVYNHDLSEAAFNAVQEADKKAEALGDESNYAQLAPLMVGPVALLTFPAVSPAHLAAALSILSPSPPQFPAPGRRKNPGYWDPATQNGLHKLLLIGGRIEGKVFDLDGVKWVGGIEGGVDGLRAQLVAMLQSSGVGLTNALESAGKNLWLTMESRRTMLEEESKKGQADVKDS